MLLPTLNNHGSLNSEDYAGPTSALKCHIGIVDFTGAGSTSLHGVGYNTPISPAAMGESVGHLVTQLLSPTLYLTCAEYTGYRSRTDSTAAWTRTVGLCADPVTLDYWMCKYVMFPCATSQAFMNPDNDFNLRRALLGCNSRGVGTLNEAEMVVHLSDLRSISSSRTASRPSGSRQRPLHLRASAMRAGEVVAGANYASVASPAAPSSRRPLMVVLTAGSGGSSQGPAARRGDGTQAAAKLR